MGIPLNLASVDQLVSQAWEYFSLNVLSWAMAAQIVVVGLVLFLTNRAIRDIDDWFNRLKEQTSLAPELSADLPFLMTFKRVTHSFLAFIFIWILYDIAEHFDWSREGIYTAGVILLAFTVMRLLTGPMKNRFWAGILAGAIWLYAALHIFHFIDPWLKLLSHITFKLGQAQISLLQLSRGLLIFLALYWLSRTLSIIWRFWLRADSGLAAAVQVPFFQAWRHISFFGVNRPGLTLSGNRSLRLRSVRRRPGVRARFRTAKSLCQPVKRLHPPGR